MGVNKVILLGNLGNDPEIFQFENGSKRARFSLATTEYWIDKAGSQVEHTEWHTVLCYGSLANLSEKFLKKGAQVYLEGRLRTRVWEDKGNKKYYTEIEAQVLNMVGRRKSDDVVKKGKEVVPTIPKNIDKDAEYDPALDSVPF